jgi:chemotaxis signal transduction protein
MSDDAGLTTEQFLTFILNKEIFAIDIAKVREVLEFATVTRIPRTPDFMRGVINLRGNVVPVIDLKHKFGMGETERTVDTCTIIVEVDAGGEQIVLGVMTDAVQEVFDIEKDQIEPPPKIGTHVDTQFIKGMGKRDDEFLIILDIDQVLTAEEMSAMGSAGNMAPTMPEVGTADDENALL